MVSCQKGPSRHAYTWQIGPFWQDTLDICLIPAQVIISKKKTGIRHLLTQLMKFHLSAASFTDMD